MATITQRKDSEGSKVYDVVFSIRDEQWKRTCKDKLVANISAKDVEARIEKVKAGQLKAPPGLNKKQLGEWHWSGEVKAPTQPEAIQHTLDDLISGYLKSSFYTDKCPNTLRGEKVKTKHLLRLLGGETKLHVIKEADLQKYVDARKGEEVVGKTIKKELDVLRAIWNGYGLQQNMVNREWRSSFPKKVKLPKMTVKRPPKTFGECSDNFESVWFEKHELDEFIAHWKERQKTVKDIYKWGYAALVYCANTSFRRGTMMSQEISLINFAKNELTGKIQKEKNTDEWTYRTVPMVHQSSNMQRVF